MLWKCTRGRSAKLAPVVEKQETRTYLAVEEVPVQPVSNPADATFIAMIDGLVYIVAPQLADAAIVPSCALVAIDTGIGHLLRVAAEHAEHVLGEPPRQGVLFYFVMT